MSFELRGLGKLDDKGRMDELINYVKIQAEDEDDPIALMSNISSFIMAIISDLNWSGFYIVGDDNLKLGPFQGLPACTRLNFDSGVCAKAYRDKKITNIEDVSKFDGHVVCDNNSASELVVPIFNDGKVVAVIDMDSPSVDRFTEIEENGFEEISNILKDKIDI